MIWPLAIACLACACACACADDHEPPLELTLSIDGRSLAVAAGVESEVSIAGTQVKVRIDIAPTRLFERAGVAFRYPRQLLYECDQSDRELTRWTLEGDDLLVMIHQFHGVADSTSMMQALVVATSAGLSELERPPTIAKTALKLGGVSVGGVSIAYTNHDSVAIREELYALGTAGDAVVLQIQDFPDGEAASRDYQAMVRLLEETFARSAAKPGGPEPGAADPP